METEDILDLVEANKLMAGIIDRVFNILLQHMTAEDVDNMGILEDVSKAAKIMKDYE